MSLKYFTKSYLLDPVAPADQTFMLNKHIITLAGVTAGDSFTITYGAVTTAAIVAGTNMTAAAIQALLRALHTDLALCTVAGTTDAGPFTISPQKASGSNLTIVPSSQYCIATNETGLTATETYSIQDVLYVPRGSFYDTTMTGFEAITGAGARGRATKGYRADVSSFNGDVHSFKGQPPFDIRRVATFLTVGSGATYEFKDAEWGTEFADESPGDVTAAAGQPMNGMLFSGDLFELADQVDLYLWYESAGDQRF